MQLYYPVKDKINEANLFGANPAQYAPLGQKGHPGLDFEAPSGTPCFAPCDGLAWYVTDSLGGDGIWIENTINGENHVVILWHLFPKGDAAHPFGIPTDGTKTLIKAGQQLAYTDNSGFPRESTGPHLHLGVMPCDPDWNPLHRGNGYLGCVDPTPFFNGKYAEDILLAQQVVEKSTKVLAIVGQADIPHPVKLDVLAQVEAFIRELLAKL